MNKSPLIILLIVAVCLSVFTSGFLFYQNKNLQQQISQFAAKPASTPAPALTWKTYTITGIYEINYPIELYSIRNGTPSLEAQWPGEIEIYPNDSFNHQSPISSTYSVRIAISKNSHNLSLDQPEKLLGKGLMIQYSLSSEKIKETTLGGLKAYRADNLPVGVAGITADLMTIKDNNIYEILVTPVQTSGNSDTGKQIFEQIISSFKFLN